MLLSSPVLSLFSQLQPQPHVGSKIRHPRALRDGLFTLLLLQLVEGTHTPFRIASQMLLTFFFFYTFEQIYSAALTAPLNV